MTKFLSKAITLSADGALAVAAEDDLRARVAQTDVFARLRNRVLRLRQTDHALLRVRVVRPARVQPVGLRQFEKLPVEEHLLRKEVQLPGVRAVELEI